MCVCVWGGGDQLVREQSMHAGTTSHCRGAGGGRTEVLAVAWQVLVSEDDVGDLWWWC